MYVRGWVWFFAVLAVLGALAVVIPWGVNVSQQLTLERLDQARSLWRERGPRDYNLRYLEQFGVEQTKDEFEVEVRGGKVVAARCNGQPTGERVYTIDDMFDHIEQTLRQDRAAGQHNYTVAEFDPTDGHPRRYVRRVRGTQDRLEWQVRLEPVNPRATKR